MHLVPWMNRYLSDNTPNLGAIKGLLPKSVSSRGQIPRRTLAFCQSASVFHADASKRLTLHALGGGNLCELEACDLANFLCLATKVGKALQGDFEPI
jgi:hypothetical protein